MEGGADPAREATRGRPGGLLETGVIFMHVDSPGAPRPGPEGCRAAQSAVQPGSQQSRCFRISFDLGCDLDRQQERERKKGVEHHSAPNRFHHCVRTR